MRLAAAIELRIPGARWPELLLPSPKDSARVTARCWERNGSDGSLSGAVRSCHRTRLYMSDLQEHRMAVALPGCVLSSHRGGQGFESPQLHRVLAGQAGLFDPFGSLLGSQAAKTVEANRDSLRPLLAVIGRIQLKDLTNR
jgi:hypothetical protein